MAIESENEVSEVPLISSHPRRQGPNNWVWLLILVTLVAGATVGALIWLDPFARGPDHHVTQWPGEHEPYDAGRGDDYERAIEHMEVLADGLRAYRRDFGGGLRWPANLDELSYAMLVPEDWDDTGVLSGKPIVYNTELPMEYDPERWVLAHDTEMGWVRHEGSRYATKGPRTSVVILADGSVKLLTSDELDSYGGLSRMAN